MKRREFITLLGGAAAGWPLVALAQQAERVRRIGVLMNLAADDPESQRRMSAFIDGLRQLMWIDGGNVQIDTRWGAADAGRIRRYAAELVALVPDVILAVGSTTVGPLIQTTRNIPIVFVQVIDPVGGGFVESLARPGGNTTGFTQFEYQHERKMVGVAEAGCAWCDAGRGTSGSRPDLWNRPIGCNPGRRAIVRDRGEPDWCARW